MARNTKKFRKSREPKEFDEKVIRISRVSKKTKGGNKIGFTALVVIGDRKGRVGVALGKATDVLSAIKKGVRKAKKRLFTVPLVDNRTIVHELNYKFGASRILLKPAPEGTGVIAGGSVRAVLELAGVKDVVAKTLGTNNKLSNVTATFKALRQMKTTVDVKKELGQYELPTSQKPAPVKKATTKSSSKKSSTSPKDSATTNSKKAAPSTKAGSASSRKKAALKKGKKVVKSSKTKKATKSK